MDERSPRKRLEMLLIDELLQPDELVALWADAWESWVEDSERATTGGTAVRPELEDLHTALARYDQTLLGQQVALFRQLDRLPEGDPNRRELWARWQTLKALRAEIDGFLFPPSTIGRLRRKKPEREAGGASEGGA